MTQGTLVLAAPAKINLFLHVTGRRADGYHLLESVFACIDFADTLTLAARADGAILRTHELAGIPADEDLAVRAARALQMAAGVKHGVAIGVEKRIPQGAGLVWAPRRTLPRPRRMSFPSSPSIRRRPRRPQLRVRAGGL